MKHPEEELTEDLHLRLLLLQLKNIHRDHPHDYETHAVIL